MKTLKRIYDWCRVKCSRIAGAIALMLPKRLDSARVKIEWFGKKAKKVLLRALFIVSMMLFLCPGIIRVGGGAGGGLPRFTYTGTYTLVDDGDGNWRIKFLSSGTLTPLENLTVDGFILGGGGGGAINGTGTGGGGAGYTNNGIYQLIKNTAYAIVIGAGGARGGGNGGTSSAFGSSALGGYGTVSDAGGNGGSGGGGYSGGAQAGGTDGSNGAGASNYGIGQHTTTREFAEVSGTLYATGGNCYADNNGAANTGNGGGGRSTNGGTGYGGSGIVVIRNHRTA